tara:strand:- start:69 stop:299 length:231 start_codon:yes stop_codon:yes gene_type:complete
MKEQTLIEIKNKVEAVSRLTQFLLQESKNLRDLAVGTLETIKQMPDYEEAIEKLKEKMVEDTREAEKIDASGKIIE